MSLIPSLNSIPSSSKLPSFTTFITEPNGKVSYKGLLTFLKGIDKEILLRLIQYSLRYLIFLKSLKKRSKSTLTLINLLALVSTLSAIRRILNLYNILLALKEISYELNPLKYYLGDRIHCSEDKKGKGKLISPSTSNSNINSISSQSQLSNQPLPGLLQLLRESLDIISNLSDNIYLFSNLSLLPLSKKNTKLVDQLSDLTSLLCSILGLIKTSLIRNKIYKEGRSLNLNLKLLEERYERREFWEEGLRDDKIGNSSDSIIDDAVERKKLKSKIKQERLKLKGLRDQANIIWYERLRLINEAIFAAYDLTRIDFGKEVIKSNTGIVSALILFTQSFSEYLKTG